MKKTVFLLSMFLLAFIFALDCYAEDTQKDPDKTQTESVEDSMTLQADGIGTLRDDVTSARKIAINDALRVAVEQAKGVMVKAETEVKEYAELKDEIVSSTRGFVSTYKILSETKEDNLYKVTLEVQVLLADPKEEAPVKMDAPTYQRKVPMLMQEAHILFGKTNNIAESLGSRKKGNFTPDDIKRLSQRYIMMLQVIKSIAPPEEKKENMGILLKALRLKIMATNIFARFTSGDRTPRMLKKGVEYNHRANELLKKLGLSP